MKEHEEKFHWDKKVRGEAQRPFRLWDSKNKRNLRWRCYKTARRALNAALLEARWLDVGATIEVYDVRTAKVHGVYKRHLHTVSFTD